MSEHAADKEEDALSLPTKEQARDLAVLRTGLARWLDGRLGAGGTLELTDLQIPRGSGVANETLVLAARWEEDAKPKTGEFVIRIQAEDPLFPGSDAELQYRMYKALEGVEGVPVPRALALESDPALLGAPFFLMERIHGRVPQDNPPFNHEGWVKDLTDANRRAMWRNSVAVLARLHRLSTERFGFLNPKDARDGLRENLNYYIERFDKAAGERHRVIEQARDWLTRHYPSDPTPGFSWGDSRYGNIIFQNDEVAAVLDWDMASLAGPEADLAWWIVFDLGCTHAMGLKRLGGLGNGRQTLALWEQLSGLKVRHLHWHLVFNNYRQAVIVRRLAKMLRNKGLLPQGLAHWEHNNMGVQYLASMLELPPIGPEQNAWPGLDA